MHITTGFPRSFARILPALLLTAAACGSDSNPAAPRPTQPAGSAPVAEVELTASEIRLPAGESLRILVYLRAADGTELTGRAVAWETSDPAVATVDADGNVTGHRPGVATVSAVSEGKRDEARVEVGPPVVDAVRLDADSLTLSTGQTRQLAATVIGTDGAVLAGHAVTWVSSDPEKATVDAAGVVTAHQVGTALVTAHVEGHEASAVVRIAAPAEPDR